jgi:4-amino-4-deoxy-L-arabinose transferase-like glycosyltransferase
VLTALSDPLRGWLLTATAIGFGVLGKGPVILVPVVPAIIFAPWWARSLLTGGRVRWYTGGLAALLLGAGIALAWAIPAGLTGGEAYRQAIFWGQSAGRVLDSFAHRNPWWSYLLWLPLMWLPWVAWPHLWAAVRRQRWDQGSRFCLAVLVPALAGLSLISGKQPKYLLPLFPLIAAWLARALVLAEGDSRRYRMIFLAALLGGSGIALAVVPWLAVGPDWLARVQSFWGLALLVWAVLFSFLRLPLAAAVRATALGTTLWTAVAYLALLEPARPVFDVAPVSRVVARLQDSGHSLAYLGRYHGQFHFTGRLRRRIEPLRERHELEGWLRGHPDGYLVVNYKKPRPDVPQSLSVYPYRGGSLVLWPVARLLADPARLDALPGNA